MKNPLDGLFGDDADEVFGESEAPVTQADIDAWEEEYQMPLPPAFAQYLLQYNGSAFGLGAVVVQEDDEDSIERILSIVHGKPNRVEDLLDQDERPEGFFPVARGLGAVEFCIRSDDGSVYVMYYDGSEDEPREVAETFGAFLLSIETDGEEEDDWL